MIESVGSDLVSCLVNRFHQRRMRPCDPSKDEKRSPDVMRVEKPQQFRGCLFNTRREFVPVLFRDQVGKRLDLEIFLDIDGKRVSERFWAGARNLRQDVYLAPRPRRTILKVRNRIIRSILRDMFLM